MAQALRGITEAVGRIRIGIRGAVQGVGFRPFVFRLAQSMQLTGWVCNSTSGVVVEAEGDPSLLDEFQLKIQSERPPLSSINSLEVSFLDPSGSDTFEIHSSETVAAGSTVVLPDIATCADCIADVLDPENRRYLYPFTNCTNCGPRFR
jgi:hydrogenase maturation protein HypF